MRKTVGQSFSDAFRGTSAGRSSQSMARYRDARTDQLPEELHLREMRIKNELSMQAARLRAQSITQELSRERLNLTEQTLQTRINQANNRYQVMLGLLPQRLQAPGSTPGPTGTSGTIPVQFQPQNSPVLTNVASTVPTNTAMSFQFDNGGLTAKQQQDLIDKGRSYWMATSLTNTIGQYQQLTGKSKDLLDQVQIAMPQLASAMNLIAKGAQYYSSAPDKGKRYISSIQAYLSGKATPQDSDVLSKAGISEISMIEAAETLSRVQALAKTNEALEKTLKMVEPQNGDTAPIYTNKQQALFDDMKKRFLQAMYTSVAGKPADLNASLDMNAFVKAGLDHNFFDSIYEPAQSNQAMPNILGPTINHVGFLGPAPINQSFHPNPAKTPSSESSGNSGKLSKDVFIAALQEKYPTVNQSDAEEAYREYAGGQ